MNLLNIPLGSSRDLHNLSTKQIHNLLRSVPKSDNSLHLVRNSRLYHLPLAQADHYQHNKLGRLPLGQALVAPKAQAATVRAAIRDFHKRYQHSDARFICRTVADEIFVWRIQ